MQQQNVSIQQQAGQSALATNKVLRNTYMLLGLTLLFSAGTATFALVTNAPPLNMIMTLVGMYGLMFLTQHLRNSIWGLASVFAFTGFIGYVVGPVINFYITNFSNGSEMVMMALGGTGLIFFTLSAYVMTTRKDFSYLGGFLFVGVMVALLMMLGAFLFQVPALFLGVSAAFVLISSGLILYQTSMIINGGERNYIMATITLYVSIYNLFMSLLSIFAALSGRD